MCLLFPYFSISSQLIYSCQWVSFPIHFALHLFCALMIINPDSSNLIHSLIFSFFFVLFSYISNNPELYSLIKLLSFSHCSVRNIYYLCIAIHIPYSLRLSSMWLHHNFPVLSSTLQYK